MSEKVVYVGRDLEAMSFALNYHRWIWQSFRPYLGKRLVEVGAGTGSFSELLIKSGPESLSLIEPSEEMFKILNDRIGKLTTATGVKTYNAIFTAVAGRIRSDRRPDSIIYVNVLEHVADDRAELGAMYQTLEGGGRIFIFVPALRWLFGSFDRQIGHVRRYAKGELEKKCREGGFRIVKSMYFDAAGIAPWWVKYRLLGSNTMTRRSVELYDRFVVPAARAFESIIEPPIGKNLLLIAEKTAP